MAVKRTGAQKTEAERLRARAYQNAWYARNKEQAAASSKAWEQKNRAKRSERLRGRSKLLARYGLTVDDYHTMLATQGGGCACCGSPAAGAGRRLYVDHDHATGKVRGLLCHKCNSGIGLLGDTVAGVQRAVGYLSMMDSAGTGAGLVC